MSSTDIQDSGEEPCFRLETLPGKSPHLPDKSPHLTLPGKASPQVNSRWDQAPQVTANGLHDIEDRILRITGYYGYNPGYSSHKSKCLNTHAITNVALSNGVEITVVALDDESIGYDVNVEKTHAVCLILLCSQVMCVLHK